MGGGGSGFVDSLIISLYVLEFNLKVKGHHKEKRKLVEWGN